MLEIHHFWLSCACDYLALALIQEDYYYCVSRHRAMQEARTVNVLILQENEESTFCGMLLSFGWVL